MIDCPKCGVIQDEPPNGVDFRCANCGHPWSLVTKIQDRILGRPEKVTCPECKGGGPEWILKYFREGLRSHICPRCRGRRVHLETITMSIKGVVVSCLLKLHYGIPRASLAEAEEIIASQNKTTK